MFAFQAFKRGSFQNIHKRIPPFTLWTAAACAVLVIFACLSWGIYWWTVAGQSLAALDAWIEREAREQRVYECQNRYVGGFPFRLAVGCTQLTMRVADKQGGNIELRLAEPLFHFNVVSPEEVTLEAQGPLLRVGDPDNPQWEVRWEKLDAVFTWPKPDGFFLETLPLTGSVQLENVIVHRLEKAAPDLASRLIEMQWRYDRQVPAVVNVGLTMREAFFGTSQEGADVVVGTELHHFPDFYPQPALSFIKDFAINKGELILTQARFSNSKIDVYVRGNMALDQENRPKGTFSLHGKGIEQLPTVLPENLLPDTQGMAVIGARLAVDASRMVFVAADGRLFVSGVPVLSLPPLY